MYKSQEIRKIAPEMDPLRMGMGWKVEDLGKPQIIVESTYGNSHPGSGHLNVFVEEAVKAAKRRAIMLPTCAMAWPRAMTASIIPWLTEMQL